MTPTEMVNSMLIAAAKALVHEMERLGVTQPAGHSFQLHLVEMENGVVTGKGATILIEPS